MVTLHNSTALERIMAEVDTFAYAMALKQDTLTDVGDRILRGALSDPDAFTLEVVGEIYDAIHKRACEIGRAKGKPMKDQTRKSRNSQVSKLNAYPTLAMLESEHALPAYEWMRQVPTDLNEQQGLGIAGYVKTVKALVAIKEALAVDADATLSDLKDAISLALAPKAVPASDAVQAIADAWEALVWGNDKVPAIYTQEFNDLLEANPNDPAKRVLAVLNGIVAYHKGREDAADRAAKMAAGGLSE